LGLAALILAWFASAANSQQSSVKERDPRPPRDKDKALTARLYTGRIVRVDAEKRMVQLKTLRFRSTDDTDKSADRPGIMLTFTVGERANITLDGKAASLRDVKAGMYARIDARSVGPAKSGGKTVDDRPTPVVGTPMTTERVEAFSRPPPGTILPGARPGDKDR